MDVAAWASQRGCPVKLLHPPVIDEVRPYVTDDRVAQEEFVKHRTALERAQTLVTIERATIRDVVGFIELPDGQICYEGNGLRSFIIGFMMFCRAWKRHCPTFRQTQGFLSTQVRKPGSWTPLSLLESDPIGWRFKRLARIRGWKDFGLPRLWVIAALAPGSLSGK